MIQALGGADIVITATGSPRPIITRAQLEAVQGRGAESLFIIDVACAGCRGGRGRHRAGVLYNIDDLQTMSAGEPGPRRGGGGRATPNDRHRRSHSSSWRGSARVALSPRWSAAAPPIRGESPRRIYSAWRATGDIASVCCVRRVDEIHAG
jgi:hypothetical protein